MIVEKLIDGEITLPDIWQAYQDGVNYNELISLAETVEENNLMYIGRQWEGLETVGLPTVILDFIKPAVQFKVASIIPSRIRLSVQPSGIAGMRSADQKRLADIVNQQLDFIIEREQIDFRLLELMTRTAVEGDGCWHIYWDGKIKTGQEQQGDIAIEQIKNANIFFGDTASAIVQDQPYIIIEKREFISNLKAYAKRIGVKDIDSIQPDTDNQYTVENDDNRVTVLILYWRDYETGTIKKIECTQNVVLVDEEDTGLELYPICWQNWEPRLNDYHGEPAVSEMVSNQITVNKLSSMKAVSISRTAFPTIIYNASLLPGGWDNSVGAAIPIENLYEVNASDVASVIEGASPSSESDRFVDNLLQQTKDLNGANDSVMGSVNPENTSAILALQKTAMVPLDLNKLRMYKFLEDFMRIAIEFMANYYGERWVLGFSEQTGKEEVVPFDFTGLENAAFNIKIDVGPSSQWSEVTELQMLDGLFDKQIVDGPTYVEFMPDGVFAGKNLLLDKLTAIQEQQAKEQQQVDLQTMLQKNPELAQRLQSLKENDPQGYIQAIKELNLQMQG